MCENGKTAEDPRSWRDRRYDAPIEVNEKRAAAQVSEGAAGCGTLGLDIDYALNHLFKYHAPTPQTLPKYEAINQAAKNFAAIVLQVCPHGSDRSAAVRKIVEAKMTANLAVALGGFSL